MSYLTDTSKSATELLYALTPALLIFAHMDVEQLNREKYDKLCKITDGYKAFLYDCDGTLADNMNAHKLCYVKTAASHGLDLDDTIVDEFTGMPTIRVVEEINRRYNLSLNAESFAASKSAMFYNECVDLTLPVAFVVQHLKDHAGKAKIAVVSGGTRRTVERTLQVIGVYDLVEVLVCAGETPNGKPFPDPFLAAARQLGVAPEDCIVFEDGNLGVVAAEAAGMKWVRIDKI